MCLMGLGHNAQRNLAVGSIRDAPADVIARYTQPKSALQAAPPSRGALPGKEMAMGGAGRPRMGQPAAPPAARPPSAGRSNIFAEGRPKSAAKPKIRLDDVWPDGPPPDDPAEPAVARSAAMANPGVFQGGPPARGRRTLAVPFPDDNLLLPAGPAPAPVSQMAAMHIGGSGPPMRQLAVPTGTRSAISSSMTSFSKSGGLYQPPPSLIAAPAPSFHSQFAAASAQFRAQPAAGGSRYGLNQQRSSSFILG